MGQLSSWLATACSDRSQVTQIGFQNVALKLEAHALALAADFDETGVFQFLDVMGERGRSYRMALAHVSAKNAFLFRADMLQDLMTARVGKSLGNQLELALGKLDGFRGRASLVSGRHVALLAIDANANATDAHGPPRLGR